MVVSQPCTLFVGKLPTYASTHHVLSIISHYGRVLDVSMASMSVVDGRPFGSAFVTMASTAEAQSALVALDGKFVWGDHSCPLTVQMLCSVPSSAAAPSAPPVHAPAVTHKTPTSSQMLLPDGVIPSPEDVERAIDEYLRSRLHPTPKGCDRDAVKLFIGNLPKNLSEINLQPFFEQVGPIVTIMVVRDRHTLESKGSAFVWYPTRNAATIAIHTFHGRCVLPDPDLGPPRPLTVRPASVTRRGFGAAAAAAVFERAVSGPRPSPPLPATSPFVTYPAHPPPPPPRVHGSAPPARRVHADCCVPPPALGMSQQQLSALVAVLNANPGTVQQLLAAQGPGQLAPEMVDAPYPLGASQPPPASAADPDLYSALFHAQPAGARSPDPWPTDSESLRRPPPPGEPLTPTLSLTESQTNTLLRTASTIDSETLPTSQSFASQAPATCTATMNRAATSAALSAFGSLSLRSDHGPSVSLAGTGATGRVPPVASSADKLHIGAFTGHGPAALNAAKADFDGTLGDSSFPWLSSNSCCK